MVPAWNEGEKDEVKDKEEKEKEEKEGGGMSRGGAGKKVNERSEGAIWKFCMR